MGRIDALEGKRKTILERIKIAQNYKTEIIDKVQGLARDFSSGKITFFEYHQLLKNNFGEKTPEEWIRYYDKYIDNYNEKIKNLNQEIFKIKTKSFTKIASPLILIFLLILISYLFVFNIKTPILFSPIQDFIENVNYTTKQSNEFIWDKENEGILNSLKISGEIKGGGEVKIYLVSEANEILILDNKNIKNSKVGINGNIVSEFNDNNETKNESIFNNKITNENNNLGYNSSNNSFNNNSEEINLENEIINYFDDYCDQSCELYDYNLSSEQYKIKIEIIGNSEVKINKIIYEIVLLEDKPASNLESNEIKKEEKINSKGKEVHIAELRGKSNIEVKSEIPDNWKIRGKNEIKVYWKEGGEYIDFSSNDLNGDGYIDEINWIISDLENEQNYEIIVITDAMHLDQNKNFLSNIYESVKEQDGFWSEGIGDGEYARVSFEMPLDNTRDITLWPRTVSGTPRVEVYEVNGTEIVAEFSSLNDNEYNKIFLMNLEGTQDSFDLKVVGGAIELDHVIDPPFATTTRGLVVYGEGTVTTPRYRVWNSSDFTAEQSTPNLGAGSTIKWARVKSSTQRNQTAVGILDDDGDILFSVRNDTNGVWENWLDVADIGATGSQDRGFDIEVEETSGDFIAVYERDTTIDRNIYYRVWDGLQWSNEGTISLNSDVASEPQRFIVLERSRNSNEIMMASASARTFDDIGAARWDGSGWSNITTITLSAANLNQERFSIAWESNSGDAIVAFGDSANNARYVLWSNSSKSWGTLQTIRNRGTGVSKITLCSDPSSDYIGAIIGPDGQADVLSVIWDGNSWLNGEPAEDTSSENALTKNAACSWTKNTSIALFGYVDFNTPGIRYFTYNKTANAWRCPQNGQTVTSLNNNAGSNGPCNTGNVMSDDVEVLRFVSDPNSNDIMAMAMDLQEDLEMFIFNGTGLAQPANALIEVITSTVTPTSPADFDYSNFLSAEEDFSSPFPYTILNSPANASIFKVGIFNITLNATIIDHSPSDLLRSEIYGIRSGSESNFYKHGLLLQSTNLNNGSNLKYNFTSPVIIPDFSTVVLYHFDNNSNYGENQTRAYDFVRGNVNLTAVGNAWPNMTGGKFAGGWKFDGNGDFLSDIANKGVLKDLDNGTFSVWINRAGNSANGIETIIQEGDTGIGYSLSTNCNNGLVQFGVRGGIFYSAYVSNSLIGDGKWHHLAGVYDGDRDKVYLYIDGNLMNSSNANTNLFASTLGLRIGGNSVGGLNGAVCNGTSIASSFNGTIDEVGIWNRSLSASEIKDLYRLKAGKYYWKANVTDIIGNNNESLLWEFTIENYPPVLTEINVTNITQNFAIINWTSDYETNSSVKYGLTKDLGINISDSNLVNGHNISLSGLNPNTLYFYNVTSCGNDGFCTENGTYNFTTLSEMNTLPNIDYVKFIDIGAVVKDVANITINFSVSDGNGASDLNDSSARVEIYNSTFGVLRYNDTCKVVSSNGNIRNYTCVVGMWYFDHYGQYTVNVTIKDNANNITENSTGIFSYYYTAGFDIYPNSISWPILNPGEENVLSIENLTINNTGNVNFTSINITAYNLTGENYGSFNIPAENFYVSVNYGDCTYPGTQLDDEKNVSLTSFSSLSPGNLSMNDGSGNEQLFFCINLVPNPLPFQSYSTNNGKQWQISLFLSPLILAGIKKRKKKFIEKKETNLNNNQLIEILGDRLEELLKVVNENRIKKISSSNSIENEKIMIPLEIFKLRIGAAEVICKYLKENKNLRISEIGNLLNRDRRTISLNYKNAKNEMKDLIKIKGENFVSIDIFSDRRLSILESAIYYLRKEGKKNKEIAWVLGKDNRNVWTIYSRAKNKMEADKLDGK